MLNEKVLTSLVDQIRAEIDSQMPQRKLAKAVALSDEIPELVSEPVRNGFADLYTALGDHEDRGHVLRSMFPDGLTFTPERTPDGTRQVWMIEGTADLGTAAARFRKTVASNGTSGCVHVFKRHPTT